MLKIWHNRVGVRRMNQIEAGHHVLAEYNSGTYIGKAIEDRGNFILVEVLAVVAHPVQGDLHKPGEVEGAVFHERKSLAHLEKMNVRKRKIKHYTGDVPSYPESLKQAFQSMKEELKKEDTPYHSLALQRLDQLEEHYYQGIWDK